MCAVSRSRISPTITTSGSCADGAQSAREGHLDLGVYLRLADAVDVVLDRILDRQNVARVVVDALECRVQRRGLAGAVGR
jgi:hypothetical protein